MYIFFYCFCRLSLSWLYNGGVGVRIVGSLLCGGYIMWVVNVDDSFSLNIKGWILNDIYLLLRYYIFRMGRWFVYMIQPCPGPDVGVILWDRFLLLHIKCFHITCSLFHQIDFFYDYVYFVSWKIPYFSTRAKPHPPCECKEECRIFKRLSKMFLYDRIYVITVGNLSFLFNLRMLSLSLNFTLLAVSYLSSHSLIVIISIYIFFALPVYGMTSICGRWEENVLTICVCSAMWSIYVLKWTTRWWNGIRIHKLHEHL